MAKMSLFRGCLLASAVYFAVSFSAKFIRLTYYSFFPRYHPPRIVDMPGQVSSRPEIWTMYTEAGLILLLLSSLAFFVILLVTGRLWSPAGKSDIAWTAVAVALIPILLGRAPFLYNAIQRCRVSPGLDHLVAYTGLGLVSGLVFGVILRVVRRRRSVQGRANID